MSDRPPSEPRQSRARSRALVESTLAGQVVGELVHLHREHFGRGPALARAYSADGLLVCVLSDVYSPAERTLIDLGKKDVVHDARVTYQRAVEEQYVEIVERIIRRHVTAFASAVTFHPDHAIEIFTLGDPIPAAPPAG